MGGVVEMGPRGALGRSSMPHAATRPGCAVETSGATGAPSDALIESASSCLISCSARRSLSALMMARSAVTRGSCRVAGPAAPPNADDWLTPPARSCIRSIRRAAMRDEREPGGSDPEGRGGAAEERSTPTSMAGAEAHDPATGAHVGASASLGATASRANGTATASGRERPSHAAGGAGGAIDSLVDALGVDSCGMLLVEVEVGLPTACGLAVLGSRGEALLARADVFGAFDLRADLAGLADGCAPVGTSSITPARGRSGRRSRDRCGDRLGAPQPENRPSVFQTALSEARSFNFAILFVVHVYTGT